MLPLGDVLLCPPAAGVPREKAMIAPQWGCRLRQTTQIEHGKVAFVTVRRPSSIQMASALPASATAVQPNRRAKLQNGRKMESSQLKNSRITALDRIADHGGRRMERGRGGREADTP